MSKKTIILASKSPRRQEILRNAGFRFTVIESNAVENANGFTQPGVAVEKLALEKANDILQSRVLQSDEIVLAADTMVYFNNNMLGKPKNRTEAFDMLSLLSGEIHSVYTGYALVSKDKTATGYEKTEVKFRELKKDEIDEYIKSGEPFDKAGAYGVQGRGSVFVERIEGDYFNVMGLPICKISMLIDLEF